MTDDLEDQGTGNGHINGRALREDILAQTPAPAAPADSAESADREATRYLSAATHLDIEYARNVVDRVLNEPLRALAPTFGVDVPVVVKWAIRALAVRSQRDRALAAVLAAQLFFVAVTILWWPWAWTLFLLMMLVAWLIVAWDHHERINKVVIGKMLHDTFSPDDAPRPEREDERGRIDAVAGRREGNLVVFSGHDMFVGSGEPMYRRHLLLDVIGRKDDDSEGDDAQPSPFTSYDLHAAIVRAFDRRHGLGKSLDNIRVHERLFVNGLHIQNNSSLLPDPLRPPPASVDEALVREAALHPSPEARAYVCVEMPGWRGQLVVTLFIRAVYAGKLLFVEWTFRVLPPIPQRFQMIDDLFRRPRYLQLTDSLTSGARDLVPALIASPVRALRIFRRPGIMRRRQFRYSYVIKRGYLFDYGAVRSIREDASGSQRQHYFLARDEGMYVLLAQQTLVQTVGEFLTDHGVDLGQFNAQVKVIFDQSIKIGDISGSTGIAIGKDSTVTVGGSGKGTN